MDMKNKRSGRGAEFYVNGSTGSDTLDEGRGESSAKPFLTLQTCINYVTDNYNLSRYTAIINCTEVSTTSALELPAYTASSGYIRIRKDPSSDADYGVQINYSPTSSGFAITVLGGTWQISDIKITATNEFLAGSVTGHFGGIRVNGLSASLSLNNTSVTVEMATTYNASGNWCLFAQSGDLLLSSGVSLTGIQAEVSSSLAALAAARSGRIEYLSGAIPLKLSGSFNRALCLISGGLFIRNAAYSSNTVIDTSELASATYKYNVYSNGGIDTSGCGTDYFGTLGTEYVEASTYSWYK